MTICVLFHAHHIIEPQYLEMARAMLRSTDKVTAAGENTFVDGATFVK